MLIDTLLSDTLLSDTLLSDTLLPDTTVHLKIYYCRLSEVVLPSVGKFILKTFTNSHISSCSPIPIALLMSLTYTRANANDDICLSLFLIFTL